jgi:dolichyl-phosphate-mannose-protein mannosyltransferase
MTGVLAGVLSTVLMYGVGARVFRSHWFGLAAAGVFALTPLQVVQSQLGAGPMWALPFVIGWLLCVVRFSESSEPRWLLAAGAILGCGLYSHLTALVMMPLYLASTMVLLASVRERPARPLTMLIAGFGLAAMPGALFIAQHPEYFRNNVNRFHIYDANRFDLVHGLREVVSWVGLTARSENYYDYFNPWFLFLQGNSLLESLRQPRVFLLPLAVLLPAGLYALASRERTPAAWLVMGGFLVAPSAASLVAEPYVARRIVFMIPFAAIIATYGIRHLLSSRSRAVRFLGFVMLAALPICFAYFYAGYVGD